jgi:hypothetical protein
MVRPIVLASIVAMLAVPAASGPALAAPPTCQGVQATIIGTGDGELIRGTRGRDVVVARGGNDRIVVGDGNDLVCAGSGDDTVTGGDGRDRLFGDDGFDVLKGGADADVLNGGLGADGCYPGAGGATLKACEEADLAVTIQAPSSVADDEPFSYTLKVRNVGGKTSGAFDLLVDQSLTNVTCGFTPLASTPFGVLEPREWAESTVNQTLGCSINESASVWHVDVLAEVSATGFDADHSNDAADARIDLVPETP